MKSESSGDTRGLHSFVQRARLYPRYPSSSASFHIITPVTGVSGLHADVAHLAQPETTTLPQHILQRLRIEIEIFMKMGIV